MIKSSLPVWSVVFALVVVCLAAVVTTVVTDAQSRAPHVVFVTGDDEYRSEITMPMIAAILEKRHGMKTSVAYARPIPQTKGNIEGLEALDTADLAVVFLRFRALPDDQLARIMKYVDAGKPLVGLRTSTHASDNRRCSPPDNRYGLRSPKRSSGSPSRVMRSSTRARSSSVSPMPTSSLTV